MPPTIPQGLPQMPSFGGGGSGGGYGGGSGGGSVLSSMPEGIDPNHPGAAMMAQGASPDEMGAAGQQPMTDAQRQELLDLLAKIKIGGQKMGSMNFVLKNHALQSKRDGLKQVFAQLAAAGVDLSNPQSVSAFMQKLQQANPDMYALFVKSINTLLDNEDNISHDSATTQPAVPGAA